MLTFKKYTTKTLRNNIMEEFTFNNNAKEQFKFFINEERNMSLNIRDPKELIACFILSIDEVKELNEFLKNFINENK